MVEALYFKTYQSFLLGDISETKMFFEFLVDEFKKRKNSEALSKKQLIELKKIKSAIDTGKIESQQWVEETNVQTTNSAFTPDIKQDDLVKRIHYEGLDTLKKLLNAPGLYLYNIEQPCGLYGAVDMVYQNGGTVYPVEVKRHEGKHDLIGQINKYTFYFKMTLHLKHYTEVQPVTLCNSYNPHTLTELKRLAVIPLKYHITEDRITIGMM